MGKLIELDAALDALREVIVPAEDIGFGDESTDGYNDGINMAVTVISGLPTVDAVPVRCKDCKYNPNPPECGNADCVLFYGMTDQMGFCHHGERREQDETD